LRRLQESIIQYSDIYEEMEVFDDEFYVQPLPDNKKSSRNKHQTFIKKRTGTMLGCHC